MRLTESGNASIKLILVMPTESLTSCEWLPGELSECSKVQLVFRYEVSDLFSYLLV